MGNVGGDRGDGGKGKGRKREEKVGGDRGDGGKGKGRKRKKM